MSKMYSVEQYFFCCQWTMVVFRGLNPEWDFSAQKEYDMGLEMVQKQVTERKSKIKTAVGLWLQRVKGYEQQACFLCMLTVETLTGLKGFLGTQKQGVCSIEQHTFKNDQMHYNMPFIVNL